MMSQTPLARRLRATMKPNEPTRGAPLKNCPSSGGSYQLVGSRSNRDETVLIFKSAAKMVQATRAAGGAPGVGRSVSSATTSSAASMPRSPSAGSSFVKKAPPPPPPSFGGGASAAQPPPPYTMSHEGSAAASVAATKRAPPPPPALKPKPKPAAHYVVALYDFEAQADGDLSFNAGDRIEIVEKTESAEDWWTGRVNGQQGVFPGMFLKQLLNCGSSLIFGTAGNYVQDT